MLQRLSFRNGQGVDRVCQGLSLATSDASKYVWINSWRCIPRRCATRSTSSSLKVGVTSRQQLAQLVHSIPAQHTPGDFKDNLVDLVGFQIAICFQEPAKAPILIFFCLGELTDLNKIDGHKYALKAN